MPIPSGDWSGNFNGTEVTLRIDPPNAAGQITGKTLNFDFRGFWDEGAQCLTFPVTVVFEGGKPVIALFKGYLFRTPVDAQPERDVVAMLAGSFELTPSSAAQLPFVATGSARRHVFGWSAQIIEIH